MLVQVRSGTRQYFAVIKVTSNDQIHQQFIMHPCRKVQQGSMDRREVLPEEDAVIWTSELAGPFVATNWYLSHAIAKAIGRG